MGLWRRWRNGLGHGIKSEGFCCKGCNFLELVMKKIETFEMGFVWMNQKW